MITASIGIPVPRDVRAILEKAQGGLHAGQMVPANEFCVGLTELGEHIDPVIDQLRHHLANVAVGPFYLNVDGLGTVGGKAPTSLHAETDLPRGLKDLHKQVGRAVREAGIELAHQRYTPGITMARFSEIGQFDLKQIMSFLSRRAGLSAGPFPVTEFALYGWRDGGAGEVLETWELGL